MKRIRRETIKWGRILKCQKKCPSKRFLKRCNTKLKFEAVQRYNVKYLVIYQLMNTNYTT